MEFTNWELQLKLYHEARVIRDSEYHLLFVRGLSTSMRVHVNREEGDLQVFSVDHRNLRHEPPAPNDLHAKAMYNHLRAIIGPLDREAQILPARDSRVSSIVPHPHATFESVITDLAPEPEQIVAWCAQIGDSIMVDQVLAAIQGNMHRRRPPQTEKQPSALCRHLACSKQHSPDDCCICSGQRHTIDKCWHVLGLPEGKRHMADQFKLHQQQSTGPWLPAASVRAIDAQVSAIQVPDKDLVSPLLTESGVILTEAEGDLHDVKEMDFGFTSAFVRHHLNQHPTVNVVSAIPPLPPLSDDLNGMTRFTLPDDGPEVSFVSRINSKDTVIAHVDTGATVMVSNEPGEIHGAIPTTSHCGTAMTGS